MSDARRPFVSLTVSTTLAVAIAVALLRVPLSAVPAVPTYSASQLQFTYSQQGRISESEVADFNCDNRPDVILSNGVFQSGQAWPVTIALSNGSGGYVNGTSTIFTGAVGSSEHLGKMLIEDYNNDGRPDVFVADSGIDGAPFTGRQNHLYLSTNDCHLIDASATHLPQQSDFTHSATVADIDSDGDVDIYVGNIWGANLIPPQIWVNDGTAHFSVGVGLLPAAQVDLNQARYTSSLFVDVNNDGHQDLVLADDQNHNQSVVLLNDGTGHFTNVPGAITQRPFGTNGVPLDVKSTDFDHDGYADLAIEFSKFNPYYQGRWIQLLRNNGNSTFTDQTATRLFPTRRWLLRPAVRSHRRGTALPMTPTPPGESEVRMQVDAPISALVSHNSVTITGWALDPKAWTGSGIDAVHVWAFRRDAASDMPSAEPQFVGAADLSQVRHEAGNTFGAQFDHAGFQLTTKALAPGTYDLVAYVWCARTGRWEDARTIRAHVR